MNRAPEALDPRNSEYPIGQGADVWSWAAMLLHMLTGRPPYCGEKNLYVTQFRNQKKPAVSRSIKAEVRELLLSCFEFVPDQRPTAEKAAQVSTSLECMKSGETAKMCLRDNA